MSDKSRSFLVSVSDDVKTLLDQTKWINHEAVFHIISVSAFLPQLTSTNIIPFLCRILSSVACLLYHIFSYLLINGRSQAGTARSNPAGGMDVSLSFECCVLAVSAPGWSRVQRSPTECGVSECNREAWAMRPWRISGCCAMREGVKFHEVHDFREKNIEHNMRVFL
jgi:hypothetical protein